MIIVLTDRILYKCFFIDRAFTRRHLSDMVTMVESLKDGTA